MRSYVFIHYIYVCNSKGASNESEILFCSTFVVDAIMYYLKRKTSILKRAKFRGRTFVLSLLTFEQL